MTWFVVVKMIWLICVLFHLCRLFFLFLHVLTQFQWQSFSFFSFYFFVNKCIIGELAVPFFPHEFGSSYNSILTILCCSCIVQNDIDLSFLTPELWTCKGDCDVYNQGGKL